MPIHHLSSLALCHTIRGRATLGLPLGQDFVCAVFGGDDFVC